MIDQQQGPEQSAETRRRSAGIVAFVAGLVLTLAFFAFFPGLPHVIDWGAISSSPSWWERSPDGSARYGCGTGAERTGETVWAPASVNLR